MSTRYGAFTILDRYDTDRKAMRPLPDTAFNTARYETVVTDKWGRFTMESGKHEYSVLPDHAGTAVMLKITASRVMVMDMKQHLIVTHRRLYGDRKQSSMEWQSDMAAILNITVRRTRIFTIFMYH